MLSFSSPPSSTFKDVHNKNKPLNIPTPYGVIPKRSKKKHNNVPIKKNSPNNSLSAPYPCFSALTPTSTSFFISIFNNFFNKESKQEEKPVGFMPRSTITDKIQMSQLVDIAVSSIPIDCYDSGNSTTEQDTCSSLSTSSSSSESSLSSLYSYYMEDDNIINSNNTSMSTEVLSDILCDHYVHAQMNPLLSDSVIMDVPLETFKMFEAPNSTKSKNNNTINSINSYENYWMTIDDEQTTKEWKLIETKHPNEQIQEIIIEEKQVIQEQDIIERHTRDIRANSAYLRMIVAEVNMMRSQKIVGPLRPRRVLPKRLDKFMHRPSPLQIAA